MNTPMYTASVPIFSQMLNSLLAILSKAQQHAEAKNISEDAFLQARLFPDMFPLLRQVQIAADFAKSVSARLADVAVPETSDNEITFEELKHRLSTTLAFIESLKPEQFSESEAREIILRPGTPKEKKLTGQSYLFNYGLPQFFFHVTTSYDLLRHSGVEIGKRDYMGVY